MTAQKFPSGLNSRFVKHNKPGKEQAAAEIMQGVRPQLSCGLKESWTGSQQDNPTEKHCSKERVYVDPGSHSTFLSSGNKITQLPIVTLHLRCAICIYEIPSQKNSDPTSFTLVPTAPTETPHFSIFNCKYNLLFQMLDLCLFLFFSLLRSFHLTFVTVRTESQLWGQFLQSETDW